jgi:hypothetical protein
VEEEEEEWEGLVERKLLRHEMAICLANAWTADPGRGERRDDERGSQI